MVFSYTEYVPAIKALSDETRLMIIEMLSCGEMCACDILEEFSISQSTLSYHMKILTESELVNAVRVCKQCAGFKDIKFTPKDNGREILMSWVPDRNVEDYVASYVIEANR